MMNFDEPGIKWQRVKRRTDSVFDYALSRNDERENKLIGRTLACILDLRTVEDQLEISNLERELR